jgi:hypothetical protein
MENLTTEIRNVLSKYSTGAGILCRNGTGFYDRKPTVVQNPALKRAWVPGQFNSLPILIDPSHLTLF